MSASSKMAPMDEGVQDPEIPSRGSGRRGSLLVEGASEPPSLDGIVDLTNTVDTTIHTRQLPAIVHEYVTPTVHHIREEKITREIHNYDIFHRIQPVIDVEILPTKHFIQNADGTLKEVPASAVPGRQNTWHIAAGPGPDPQRTLSTDLETASSRASESILPTTLQESSNRNPIKISHHTLPSSDGIHRTETTWQHPAKVLTTIYDDSFSTSGLEGDNHRHSPYLGKDSKSQQTRNGEDGNLPGVERASSRAVPRSVSTTSDSIRAMKTAMGQAPNTLRKWKTQIGASVSTKSSDTEVEDVENRMEGLNVRQ